MTDKLSIPGAEFEARLKRTQSMMSERGLDGLVLFSSYQEREGHVSYLTNHHNAFPNVLSHMGMGHSALVLPADGLATIVAPMGYEANKVVNVDGAKTGYSLTTEVVAAVKERGLEGKKLGFVGSDVIPFEYWQGITQSLPKAEIIVANDILEGQRLIKSAAEVSLLREAAKVADAALAAGIDAVREGATGHDLDLAARKAAFDAGADFVPRIRVSMGPRIQTLSWPMSTNQKMAGGDFVYLDVIGWVGGYTFDNSRVTVVGGPNDEQRDYLEHMVEATDWMVGLLQPGAEIFLGMNMSRDRQIMPFGHGIGLEVCEHPWLTVAPVRTLVQPNIVVNVEPIVMDPQLGGACIEEIVLVTESGPEVLNQCPRVFW
jgi:Xaa-Pro aminopeptidase